jgi:hypothetical protein
MLVRSASRRMRAEPTTRVFTDCRVVRSAELLRHSASIAAAELTNDAHMQRNHAAALERQARLATAKMRRSLAANGETEAIAAASDAAVAAESITADCAIPLGSSAATELRRREQRIAALCASFSHLSPRAAAVCPSSLPVLSAVTLRQRRPLRSADTGGTGGPCSLPSFPPSSLVHNAAVNKHFAHADELTDQQLLSKGGESAVDSQAEIARQQSALDAEEDAVAQQGCVSE